MDKKELSELVKSGESPTLEFKEALNNSIGKEMCAFANSKGGKILLGIGDSGEIIGTKITNNLKSQVQDYARNIEPPLIVLVEEAGDVLVVEVPEGKDKPYSANGRFYSRQGANTQQLKRDEIRRFFEKEGLLLFDEKVNSKFNLESDFNQDSYDHFLKASGISPGLEKEDVLRNLKLLDGIHMKNAGVLLFCNDVKDFFLNASITCALFEGNSKVDILDRKEFEGGLVSNFENAFIYVRSKLNTNYIINDKYRVEKLELPKEAIREAILNAIAHRDYFSNANIQIYIFKDRVEVVNPGGLIKGMKMNELGKRSEPRNHLLFSLLHRADLVEQIGSGVLRMRKAMKRYGLRPPLFDVNEDWFSITFLRPEEGATEKNTQENTRKIPEKYQKIIEAIREKPEISRKELSSKLKETEATINSRIRKLVKEGVLSRIGPDKGGKWEIIQKEESDHE